MCIIFINESIYFFSLDAVNFFFLLKSISSSYLNGRVLTVLILFPCLTLVKSTLISTLLLFSIITDKRFLYLKRIPNLSTESKFTNESNSFFVNFFSFDNLTLISYSSILYVLSKSLILLMIVRSLSLLRIFDANILNII